MKKFIITVIIVILLYLVSYLIFGNFLIGYKNNHFIIYKYTCTDVCPDQGYWYKMYYGNISYEECIVMGGEPALVGFMMMDVNGKPLGSGGIGGYDGCKVK